MFVTECAGRPADAKVLAADSRGTRIVKEHKQSTRRIDLAVAAIMAHAVAVTVAPGPQIWIKSDRVRLLDS